MRILDALLTRSWSGTATDLDRSAVPANVPALPRKSAESATSPPRRPTREQSELRPFGSEHGLTVRESEALALAIKGKTNDAIASEMDVELGTVKLYLTNSYRKLQVKTRCEAMVLAWRLRESQAPSNVGQNAWQNWFSTCCRPQRVTAGDVLFRKGEPGDSLYLLNDGAVALEDIDSVVTPGGVFGEIAVFTPARIRTFTAVCVSDADLLCVSSTQAKQLYYARPEFAFRMLQLITSRLLADRERSH